MATATEPTKMERCMEILMAEPDLPTAELAERVGCDAGTAKRARARLASEPREVPLSALDLDSGTQMRPDMDHAREAEFRELMGAGVEFDPVEVYDVGGPKLILTDGFHRTAAAIGADFETIRAIVRRGTMADAMRAAARANGRGTLPRCDRTLRNAVFTLMDLHHAEHPDSAPSVGAIAEGAMVSQSTARKHMDAWHAARSVPEPETVTGKDGKQYPARKPSPADQVPARGPAADPSRNGSGSGEQNGIGHRNGDVRTVETFDPADVPGVDEPIPDDAETIVIKPNLPSPEEKARKQAMDDERWLEEELVREGRKPVRPRLSEANRRIFDRAALRYRRWAESPTCVEARKLLRSIIEDRKVSGEKDDPFSLEMSRFLRVEHPRDWTLCPNCKGSGAVNGRECSKGSPNFGCGGCGFKLR